MYRKVLIFRKFMVFCWVVLMPDKHDRCRSWSYTLRIYSNFIIFVQIVFSDHADLLLKILNYCTLHFTAYEFVNKFEQCNVITKVIIQSILVDPLITLLIGLNIGCILAKCLIFIEFFPFLLGLQVVKMYF